MKHQWFTQNNQPVIRNFGLIIGKNKIPLENSIVGMLNQYGYKQEEAEQSLNANKHNQITTIYYLLHKRYEKLGKLPSHFNIINRCDENKVEDPVSTPKKKMGVLEDVKSPDGSNFLNITNSGHKKAMDSQREIELSCSPVKKSRKIQNESPSNLSVDFKNRAEKIEEKGSRSPDKKKRRGGDVFDESQDLNFKGDQAGMMQLKLLSNFNNHSRELQQTHDSVKKSQESKKNDDTSSASAQGPAPVIIRKDLFGPASQEPKKQPQVLAHEVIQPSILDEQAMMP